MAGRYSPPPHPHPERSSSFNPLAHLLSHLADSPPTSPAVFTSIDLGHPDTHDPEDILREIRTDGDNPFPIDRNVLKSVVAKRMRTQVTRITFLSSGTFHKAFLVTLADEREIVARIARRYMPKLKTESEVATINYIRQHTDIPVPVIYHFDTNPYNRLGGEYILMSKAPGVPLHRAYHQFTPDTLRSFLTNLAKVIITLYSHRFPMIGSLYQTASNASSQFAPTPHGYKFRVGPIISWPFFGGGRGERTDIPRGPWATEKEYLQACAEREIQTVKREGEGRLNPHKPHLPPPDEDSSSEDETGSMPSMTRVNSSIGIKPASSPMYGGGGGVYTPQGGGPVTQNLSLSGRMRSGSQNRLTRPSARRQHSHRGAGLTSLVNSTVHSLAPSRAHSPEPEEMSSSSDEDTYRDYRSGIRSSLLVAHQQARVDSCRADMDLFIQHMTEKLGVDMKDPEFSEFALDLHDLSSSNVFVDPDNLGKISCIIDWESTTIRPLWQCAHLPAFLMSEAHAAEAVLFRQIISDMASLSAPAVTRSISYTIPIPSSSATTNGVHNHQNHRQYETSPDLQTPRASPPTSTSHKRQHSHSVAYTSPDVHPPPCTEIDTATLKAEAGRWLRAECEREPWRRAHKVIEWDGWEEGLVALTLNDEVRQLDEAGNSFLGGPIINGVGFEAPSKPFVGVGGAGGVGGYRGVGFGAFTRGFEDVLEGVEDEDDVVTGGFSGIGPDPSMLKKSLARVVVGKSGGNLVDRVEPVKPKAKESVTSDDGSGYFGFVGASGTGKPKPTLPAVNGIGRGDDQGGYFGLVAANPAAAKPKLGNGVVGKLPFGFVGVGTLPVKTTTAATAGRFRDGGDSGW
ncbi:hypothetical protein FRB95_011220 [Tulasnella sp. JGI-2019a]|nr:hypothetical protein FRB95_011220 [Tulasnella sp. JGI-2019a]